MLFNANNGKGTNLSLCVFGAVSFQHSKSPEAEQLAKPFYFERFPVVHSIREIHNSGSKVFFIDRIICRVQDCLDGIDCFGDISLEFFVWRLFFKFLQDTSVSRPPYSDRNKVPHHKHERILG